MFKTLPVYFNLSNNDIVKSDKCLIYDVKNSKSLNSERESLQINPLSLGLDNVCYERELNLPPSGTTVPSPSPANIFKATKGTGKIESQGQLSLITYIV